MSSDTWTTYPAQPHTLPFRTILGEYHARRPQDLAETVLREFLKPERAPGNHASAALADLLHSAHRSKDLAETAAKQILESEHRPGDLAVAMAKHILKLTLTAPDLGTVWTRLDADITKSEQAYRDLAVAKEHLQAQRQTRAESLERFKAKLVEAYERVLVACRRVTITIALASKLSWPVAAKSCSPSNSILT